jgi:hypothetical protein
MIWEALHWFVLGFAGKMMKFNGFTPVIGWMVFYGDFECGVQQFYGFRLFF